MLSPRAHPPYSERQIVLNITYLVSILLLFSSRPISPLVNASYILGWPKISDLPSSSTCELRLQIQATILGSPDCMLTR